MGVRIVLMLFLFVALNLSQKTLPSAQKYEEHPLQVSSPFGRGSVKDFTTKKLVDILAHKFLRDNTDDILPEDSNNDTVKDKKDFIAPLLNDSSDISANNDFDIQEGIEKLDKMKAFIEQIEEDLKKKHQSMGQSDNNKSTSRHITHFHRDYEEYQTVYPSSLELSNLVSTKKTSDTQREFVPQVSNELDKDVDTHILFQSTEKILDLLSEDPHISESKAAMNLKSFSTSTITETTLNTKTELFSSVESTYKTMDKVVEYGSETQGTRRNQFHSQSPYYSTLSEKNDIVSYMTKQEMNLSEKHSRSSDIVERKLIDKSDVSTPIYRESSTEEILKKENILPLPYLSVLLYENSNKDIGNDVQSTETFDKMLSEKLRNEITESYSAENTDEGDNKNGNMSLNPYRSNFVLVDGNDNKFVDYDIQSTETFHEMMSKISTKGVTEIDSAEDTTENILSSTNIAISPLVFGNNNKGEHIDQLPSPTVISTGDIEIPPKLRQELFKIYIEESETTPEYTLMDFWNEISLSSLNDRNTGSDVTEPSTSAAMPRILISTYPTLHEILHEHGSSVASQRSVTDNIPIKDTWELRKESTFISTKNSDRLFSDFSTKEETTTTPLYKSEKSLSDVMLNNIHDSISRVSEPKYLNNVQTTKPVVYKKISENSYNDDKRTTKVLLKHNTGHLGVVFPNTVDTDDTGTSNDVPMIKAPTAQKFKADIIATDKLVNLEKKERESNNSYSAPTVSVTETLLAYFAKSIYVGDLSEGNKDDNNFEKDEYMTLLTEETNHSSELDDSDIHSERDSHEIHATVDLSVLKTTDKGDVKYNSESGTESTMIQNVFATADKALDNLKNIVEFLKNSFTGKM